MSRVGEREGETFVSPSEQRDRIQAACARDGLELVEVLEELNVSGGAPLEKRSGLKRAVELVEGHGADVVVVAYFDRLVRSLQVQHEVVERVEKADGAIVAVDVGEVRADTAGRWLSSTMLGMVAEYHRRVTAERTSDAKKRAVARGVAPFPNLPPGLHQGKDGEIKVHKGEAKIVVKAFDMRAKGATIGEVQAFLRSKGIERSFHGTQALLGSRMMLGELHFGDLVNLKSHPAIIDKRVFAKVQRMRVSRGRRAKSERLLARLGVLRCATCGGRMSVGTTTQGGRNYAFYRCSPISDCKRRVTVSADMVESVVVDEVKRLLEGTAGSATVADGLDDAVHALELAENELDAAVRAFTGLEDVDAARERLIELREQRDGLRDEVEKLRAASAPALTVTASGDWGRLTMDEQRALIVAVVDRVDVAPGRGADRITVHGVSK